MLSGGPELGKGSYRVMVLVVEDEDVSRRALVNLLAMSGYPTRAVPSAEEALALAEEQLPDVAVVDLDLPGMNGAKLIESLLQAKPQMKAVLLTAADPERVSLMSGGKKLDQLRKPIDFNDLLEFLAHPDHSGRWH
jgi:two-component system response regulator RegA